MWRLISNKRYRDIMGWLGGGIAAIAGGAWAVYIYLVPADSPKPVNCTLEASKSVAACRDIIVHGPIDIGVR